MFNSVTITTSYSLQGFGDFGGFWVFLVFLFIFCGVLMVVVVGWFFSFFYHIH